MALHKAQDLMDAIAEAVEEQRKAKISASRKDETQQKIVTSPANRNVTDTKLAESFGTNRTYVNQARKIKEAAPEIAEKVRPDKKLSSLNMTATGF